MPKRCVAANCSNVASEHISLFKFPKGEKLCQDWTKQVQRTRGDWQGPTVSSLVCSAHFAPECFDQAVRIQESLGFKQQHKRRLLPSAVPTVFRRKCEEPTQSSAKRRSTAVEKLERKRVASEALTAASTTQAAVPEVHAADTIEENICNIIDVACQTDVVPTKTRDVGMYAKWKGKSKGTQTDSSEINTIPLKEFTSAYTQTVSESSESSDMQSEEENHTSSEYEQSSSDTGNSDDSYIEDEPSLLESHDKEKGKGVHNEKKYIVFFSALLRLLTWVGCPGCGHKDLKYSEREIGTLLIITLYCHSCGRITPWHSQPYLGNIPAGNILLSGAILFAGATVSKVLLVLRHMGIAAISTRTFFRHQKDILFKAIRHAWTQHQIWLLASLQGQEKPLICGGDGRADSPGHCAKYGTYTMIELEERVILDIQLVQSNECGGSYHMEKEGLVRSLAVLERNYLEIDVLITDRHRQIAKYIREEHPRIQHLYDVWHVAKGIKTKLRAAGRKSGCQSLNAWTSSIVNHLYWSASSTPQGQGQLIEAKWKSVVEHAQNHHHGFDGDFPQCAHQQLEGREAKKQWIVPMSKSAMELEKIITNASLCRDSKSLSGKHQTSILEAFHSLLIQFAPKMLVFSYEGMLCRTMLAALHFNENNGRKQRKSTSGRLQYGLRYPKYKQGGHVVKKVLVPQTYTYVDDLMEWVATALQEGEGDDVLSSLIVPPPLNAEYVHPDKDEAVQAHVTRFKSN